MLKKWILLLVIIVVASLILPVGATQYNPPWAHNYGFNYTVYDPDDYDSRPHATNASNYQSIVGYNAYNLSDSRAYVGYTSIKDDAVVFIIAHGVVASPLDRGGGLAFYNGTLSYIFAEDNGITIPGDKYLLSSMSTELADLLLAVYASCYSSRTSPSSGNLVDMTQQKGADNVIGFSNTVYWYPLGYWSDRFWYRCLYGQAGGPQTIRDAAVSAKYDVLAYYGSFGGTNYMFGRYRFPYDYLNPARYGAV